MIKGFIILIALLLFGNTVSDVLSLPVPGAVIGMVLLLIGLCVIKRIPDDLGTVSDGLIRHIGLLYIPAGAGISMYFTLIAQNWITILLACAGSTILTLGFVALSFRYLRKKAAPEDRV